MKFGKSILFPSYNRKSDFDSFNEIGKKFSFEFVICRNIIEIDFQSVVGQEFGWHSEFDDETYTQIKKFYNMNSVSKTPNGGKTAILKTACDNCRASYLIYAGVNEYHNSAYKVILQGITEIIK